MKMRFVILLMLLFLSQALLGKEAKFYGFIYKYPITMQINFEDDGKVSGHYFYDKQKKPIKIAGHLETGNKKLLLQDANKKEIFEGYLVDYQEKKENRIIGKWKYKNKVLPFELQTQHFTADEYYHKNTGLDINPIADNYFQTKEMEVFTDTVFRFCYLNLYGSTQINFDAHPNIADKNDMQEMMKLVEKIRSEIYDGYSYSLIVYRNLLVDLLRFYYDPSYYLKHFNKETSFDEMEKDINNYFTLWSFASVYNFNLFKELKREEQKARKGLVSFYLKKHFSKPKAKFLADYIQYFIRKRAYGSSPSAEYRKIPDLLQKIIAGDETKTILAEISTEKYDNQELFLCLNATILLKRDKKIIKKLLKEIENINSFDESPLSCAAKDLSFLKFLVENEVCKLDLDHANWFGKTPLFYAIQYNNHAAVEYLLEKGARINKKYTSKAENDATIAKSNSSYCYNSQIYHTQRTPLMHAAQNADVKMLKLLLKKGANLKDLDEKGFNALDYAIADKKKENIIFLKKLGLNTTKNRNNFYNYSLDW